MMGSNVAPGAEVLVEELVIAIGLGALGRRDAAAAGKPLDMRGYATTVQGAQFLLDSGAGLAGAQRSGTRSGRSVAARRTA